MHFSEMERKFIREVENVACMLRPLWKNGPLQGGGREVRA